MSAVPPNFPRNAGRTGWRRAIPVALEGTGFAVPITVGGVAVLFARIDVSLMAAGLLAALVGMVVMQLVTAGAGRPMVYMVRVLEATTLLGFLDHFILKMPGWGLADTPAHRLMLVICVSVGTALLLPIGHALRLQRFARMIPTPVFAGFSTALAVTLLISQSAVLLRSVPGDGAWFAAVAALVLAAALVAQRYAERWPPGVIGLLLGTFGALALAAAGGHGLASVMQGQLVLAFPVALVHWPDLWAPQVDTSGLLRDVVLASGTMALLVFLNTVVNEEAVTQIDGAQPLRHDWLRSGAGRIVATLLGSAPLTASIGPTRAAVRIGRLDWRAMALIGLLTLAVLVSGLLTWVPLAGICGLLLLDAWNSFDRPSIRLAWQSLRGRRLVRSEKEDMVTIGLVVATAVLFNMVVGVFVGVFSGLVLYAWRNGRRLARTVATGETVRSNCSRSAGDTARLAANAGAVRFVALEGALFFGAANALQALLREQSTPGNFVVVDWSHVVSADSTVASAFARAVADAHAVGARIAVSGLEGAGAQLGETLRTTGLQAPVFPDADRALEWAENEVIAAAAHDSALMPLDGTTLQEALTLLKGLTGEQRDALEPLFEQRFFRTGETVFVAGQRASELMVILQGSVDILVAHSPQGGRSAGRDVRLARIRRGAMLGELSFLDGSARAASAVATEDLLVGVLSRAHFDAFAGAWPDAGRRVMANLALDLAFRLRRTNHIAVSNLR